MIPWVAPSLKEITSMALLLKLLSAAAFGALDLWAGIPVGLALGLPPVLSGIAATSAAC